MTADDDPRHFRLFAEEIKPRLDQEMTFESIAEDLDIDVGLVSELVDRFTTPYCQRDGPDLFQKVREWFLSMFHFDEPKDAALVALMIFQTRVFKVLPCVFYLFIMGRLGSGKSCLLSAMAMLGRGLSLGNVSPAAMARELGRNRSVQESESRQKERDAERAAPYLMGCFDEYDAPGQRDRHDTMDELLRHGYRRNGPPYVRYYAEGRRAEYFDMYMPKAVAVASSSNPALSSRGFKVSAAPYAGSDGFDILINNRYPRGVEELVTRLDKWGEDALACFNEERIEALERSPDHAERVRLATGSLGANRESELVLTATTIAHMIGVDLTEELRHGVETLSTANEEDEDEVEELQRALLDIVEGQASREATASVTVKQTAVKKAINEELDRMHRKPLGDRRLAAVYRAAGIKTSWIRNRRGRNYWVIPISYIEHIRGLVNLPNVVNPDEPLGQRTLYVDQVGRVRQLREDAANGVSYETLVDRYGSALVERERIPRVGGRGE